MKRLIIAMLLLSTHYIGVAQAPSNNSKKIKAVMIVKLNNQQIATENLYLNAVDIQSLDVVPAPDIKKYSADANVVIIITPKNYVNLLTLPQFYNNRKIEEKYRNRITMDGKVLSDTTNFLIDDKSVKSIIKKGDGIEVNTKLPK